jgi:hypothetical protein
MARISKITSSLSVAATLLLEACSSSGSSSDSSLSPVANTLAPELVGTWQTTCIAIQNSATLPDTVTGASGGSSGGSGGVSNGSAYRTSAIFTEDGHVEFIAENFATANCNANTRSSLNRYNAIYFIGEPGFANDGSQVTAINYTDPDSTTYSIFQLVNNTELYLGDPLASTPGYDGSSDTTRFDGLGARMTK